MQILDVGETERFVRAALAESALVSNGYNSFWRRVGEERNREVGEQLLKCIRNLEG